MVSERSQGPIPALNSLKRKLKIVTKNLSAYSITKNEDTEVLGRQRAKQSKIEAQSSQMEVSKSYIATIGFTLQNAIH